MTSQTLAHIAALKLALRIQRHQRPASPRLINLLARSINTSITGSY